ARVEPSAETALGVVRRRRPEMAPAPINSPPVVREGPVGLGHLVGVLAALDRGTETVRCVEDLVGETLGHRLLATTLRVAREPAQGEGVGTVRLDLDRHLVRRTTDTAALDLDGGA